MSGQVVYRAFWLGKEKAEADLQFSPEGQGGLRSLL